MPVMTKSPKGDDIVILSRKEYDRLLVAANEDVIDAATARKAIARNEETLSEAEIDELLYSCLGQVIDGPAEEGAVLRDDVPSVRLGLEQLAPEFPVSGVVVVTTEEEVVQPGDARPVRLHSRRCLTGFYH